MHPRQIALAPGRQETLAEKIFKNSKLIHDRGWPKVTVSACHVTQITALTIAGVWAVFAAEFVLWLTDRGGIDA